MIEWYFIQMAIMLLSAYPLALLYTSIIAKHYQTHWRHLYSVVVSFLLYNALFPVHDFIQLLLLSTGVYYIITCSSKTSTLHSQRPNPWIPVTVFILSMSCLVLNHLAAQVWNHSTATIGT